MLVDSPKPQFRICKFIMSFDKSDTVTRCFYSCETHTPLTSSYSLVSDRQTADYFLTTSTHASASLLFFSSSIKNIKHAWDHAKEIISNDIQGYFTYLHINTLKLKHTHMQYIQSQTFMVSQVKKERMKEGNRFLVCHSLVN